MEANLETQLREAYQQHKRETAEKYNEVRMQKRKEQLELDKYKSLQRKGIQQHKQEYISQQKLLGDVIEKNKDIYLSKDQYLDDRLRYFILSPQKVYAKGMKEIAIGKSARIDGCFEQTPKEKLSQKQRKYLEECERKLQLKRQQRYQELLDSQTGLTKKLNQQKKLEELKVFKPNKFIPTLFDDHPSHILALTSMHQHTISKVWKPPNFNGYTFEEAASSFLDKSQ